MGLSFCLLNFDLSHGADSCLFVAELGILFYALRSQLHQWGTFDCYVSLLNLKKHILAHVLTL